MAVALFGLRPVRSLARWSTFTRQRSHARMARCPGAAKTATGRIQSFWFRAAAFVGLSIVLSLVSCSKGGADSDSPAAPSTPAVVTLEQQTHAKINAYRVSKGLAPLTWRDLIADQARQHSQNMAAGTTPFGHDGFLDRVAIIQQSIPWSNAAENVATMYRQDPVAAAVAGWLNSPPHLSNIEGNFDLTGVGTAEAKSGFVYFTQVFIKSK